jgi:hypothetical protein
MATLAADALRPVRAQGRIIRRSAVAAAAGRVRAVALQHAKARAAFHQMADRLFALELVFPDRRACEKKEDAEREDRASGCGPLRGRQPPHETGMRKEGASPPPRTCESAGESGNTRQEPVLTRDVCTILRVRVSFGAPPTGSAPLFAFSPRRALRSESEAPRQSLRPAGSRATRCLLARARLASRTQVPTRCPLPWS